MYLGLLIVGGAAPQAFAHSATTRAFEITDEIEVKDDLDTNPGDETQFAESVASLIRDLDALAAKGEFDWKAKNEISIEDLSFDKKDNSPAFIGFGNLFGRAGIRFQSTVFDLANSLLDLKVKAGAGEKHSRWPETLDYKLFSNGTEFKFEVSIAATDEDGAKRLGSQIAEYLVRTSKDSKSVGTRIVAENTTSKVDDVKVILVTNLPRAALDSLLAKDAK